MNTKSINKISNIKQIVSNKKAYFDYEVIKEYECGIILQWHEVKSIRAGHINLKASFVIIRENELFVNKMNISPYKMLPNKEVFDPLRERKLLLHKKSIDYLSWKLKEKWFTIVPLEVYFKWNLIKIKIALVKWKKLYEKKETIKKRDTEMDIRRSLSERI